MGILEDIMKTLDRVPVWKRLQNIPDEVDVLKDKVEALESMLNGKYPADVCKYCGERAVRLTSNLGPDDRGKMHQTWTCSECNQGEKRIV